MEISAMKLNEDKLQEVVIDFSEWRSNVLNESWLRMFGLNIEYLLKAMFGGNMVNAKIRGNKREINSFARTLSRFLTPFSYSFLFNMLSLVIYRISTFYPVYNFRIV